MGNLMSVKRQGGLRRGLAKKTNCGTNVLPQYLSATQYLAQIRHFIGYRSRQRLRAWLNWRNHWAIPENGEAWVAALTCTRAVYAERAGGFARQIGEHLLAAKIEGLVTPTTGLRKDHMSAYAGLAAQKALGSLAGPSGPCAWKEHA